MAQLTLINQTWNGVHMSIIKTTAHAINAQVEIEVKEIEVAFPKENTTVIIQPTEEKRFRWGFGLALGFGFIYD